MSTQDRIKYIEGSSLPHFEQGDGGPMTKDEAVQMVLRNNVRRVAKFVEPELHAFIENELYFRGSIGQMISEIARSIMGRDRPLSDDDQEYYAFCDYLYRQVTNQLEACLDSFIKGHS